MRFEVQDLVLRVYEPVICIAGHYFDVSFWSLKFRFQFRAPNLGAGFWIPRRKRKMT